MVTWQVGFFVVYVFSDVACCFVLCFIVFLFFWSSPSLGFSVFGCFVFLACWSSPSLGFRCIVFCLFGVVVFGVVGCCGGVGDLLLCWVKVVVVVEEVEVGGGRKREGGRRKEEEGRKKKK